MKPFKIWGKRTSLPGMGKRSNSGARQEAKLASIDFRGWLARYMGGPKNGKATK